MAKNNQPTTHGFAAVEIVLLLVIVGLVAGVGYWVHSQRKQDMTSTTAKTVTSRNTGTQPGTTAAVEGIAQSETNDEEKSADKAISNISGSVQQTQSTTAAVGSSYDETGY